jgi:hypothetical protein
MQVCERTAADKKGGHLALRKSDGKFMLRESAMCPDAGAGYKTTVLADQGLGCEGLGPTCLMASSCCGRARFALMQVRMQMTWVASNKLKDNAP